MLLNKFTFHRPKSLEEASTLSKNLDDNQILAGGTFIINKLKILKKKGLKTPKNIISLSKIEDLKGISTKADNITIGSMTTISEIFHSSYLTENLSVLKDVCRNLGTTTIRNMATLGGNLTCRYTWTELAAALIALNGQMVFIGSKEKEEITSAEDFFKTQAKTDKILKSVLLKKEKKSIALYKRINKRAEVDIPLFAVCINAELNKKNLSNVKVSVNNGISFAKRDNVLENFLNKTPIKNNLIEDSLNHLDETIYDTRSDDYKKYISRITVKNIIKELVNNKK